MDPQGWNWDELLGRPGQEMWRYPLEEIIPFARELQARGMTRVCDLGCGGGRHTVFLAARGFRVWGSDISARALERTRGWLQEAGLQAEALVQADMAEQAFPADCFDAVVCVHTIYHQTTAGIHRTLNQIRTMLRPGGLLFCTFASTASSRFHAEGHTRVEERTLLKPDAGGKTDVLTHYVDRAHLDAYLTGFDLIKVIHKVEEEKAQHFWRHAHYIVWAERPA